MGKIGIIMNGVTGRMGTTQHLVRSIAAIIKQGGVKAGDAVIMPEPVLTGRGEEKPGLQCLPSLRTSSGRRCAITSTAIRLPHLTTCGATAFADAAEESNKSSHAPQRIGVLVVNAFPEPAKLTLRQFRRKDRETPASYSDTRAPL